MHSKKAVLRAGEMLIYNDAKTEDRWEALDVLSDWRAVHAYPTHALLILLRTSVLKVDGDAIIVRRLKRTPSILKKLARFPDMKLHRMQDIGGCRAVVGNCGGGRRFFYESSIEGQSGTGRLVAIL